MKINKYILKKELLIELKNSSSLFLITPTMSVLIIIFPILIENRFAVDEDLFIISRLLFLIIFSTLFAIRKPIVLNQLTKELNFGNSGTLARLLIGILATTPRVRVYFYGDSSLNKRSMKKLILLMSEFGASFFPKNKFNFPLKMHSSNFQNYRENLDALDLY